MLPAADTPPAVSCTESGSDVAFQPRQNVRDLRPVFLRPQAFFVPQASNQQHQRLVQIGLRGDRAGVCRSKIRACSSSRCRRHNAPARVQRPIALHQGQQRFVGQQRQRPDVQADQFLAGIGGL